MGEYFCSLIEKHFLWDDHQSFPQARARGLADSDRDGRRCSVRSNLAPQSRQREVDFVAQQPNRTLQLIQVAWSLKNPTTRMREIEALTSAMSALSLMQSTLITFEEEEDIRSCGTIIKVRPAWAYLAGR
jgi:predicted AAA+ superfamily ATPase